MKHIHKLLAALLLCAAVLTACEKHDGVNYCKSKCIAELNGQTYYDQLPLLSIFSPEAITTPSLSYYDGMVTFDTDLSKERGGTPLYYIFIFLYGNSMEELAGKVVNFEKKEIEYPDGEPSMWYYAQYCDENKIAYARINGEVAEGGSFHITSYDEEKEAYSGTFTLHFSEGTMTGEFSIGN